MLAHPKSFNCEWEPIRILRPKYAKLGAKNVGNFIQNIMGQITYRFCA